MLNGYICNWCVKIERSRNESLPSDAGKWVLFLFTSTKTNERFVPSQIHQVISLFARTPSRLFDFLILSPALRMTTGLIAYVFISTYVRKKFQRKENEVLSICTFARWFVQNRDEWNFQFELRLVVSSYLLVINYTPVEVFLSRHQSIA